MHCLQCTHTILFCDHAAGSDFTGGDEADVDAGVGQCAEHAPCGSGRGGHAGSYGTHPCDGFSVLERRSGPLGQQGCQGDIGSCAVVFAQDEADVPGAVAVLALRLDDGIEADAVVGEGGTESCGGAGAVGNVAHTQLHLIAIQSNPADLWFASTVLGWVQRDLGVIKVKGILHGLQGLAAGAGINHAAHLHFAGRDQAQIDALLGQAGEQAGGNAGAPHDSSAADAEFGEAAFGR